VVEYGAHSIETQLRDLLSLRTAVDGLLDAFGIAATSPTS
jgi:hypothetical protein